MADRIRDFGWGASPLGPAADWPQSLRTLVDAMLGNGFPTAILWGPELTCIHNDGYLAILGGKPEAIGRPFLAIWAEARDVFAPELEQTMAGGAVSRQGVQVALLRGDAPDRAVLDYAFSPLRDEAGRVAGVLHTVREVTQQRSAEIERRRLEHERRDRAFAMLDRFFELSHDLLAVASSRDGHWKRVNPAFTRLLGWTREELLSTPFLDLIHPDEREAARLATEELSAGLRQTRFEHRIRCQDGSYRWVSWNTASRPEDGLLFCVGRDITEQRRTDERERLVAAELDHRVRNVLAVVQSLAAVSLRGLDPAATEAFRGRIVALGEAHGLVSAVQGQSADLGEIVGATLAPYADRVTSAGPAIRVGARAAQALALVLHELATNAAKHGALSTGQGRVSVHWRAEEDGMALEWRETGGPRIDGAPAGRGFGTRLIQGSIRGTLGGEAHLDFRPEGLNARLRLPPAELGGGSVPEVASARG